MNEKVCGAKLRGRSARCKNKAIAKNGRCRLHGGKTPTGMASPNYRHGRYSRYMSLGLTDRIAEMNADGEMLGLRSEIALVTVEIERELKRIYSAESSDQNNTIRDLIAEHRQVLASHESDNRIITESNRVLSRLEKAIKEANRNSISLATIWPLFEVRRKLVATELQREKAMNTSFSPERAVLFVRDLGGVISRLVKDQDTRREILVEFEKIMRR